MSTFTITASLLTHSLAWALLFSLWQGLLIYAMLYVLLKAMPHMTARAKHYASFASLTGLFIWFADTWAAEYQKLRGTTVYITRPGSMAGLHTPLPAVTYTAHTITPGAMDLPLLQRLLPHIEYYYPIIVLIYALGLSFMLVRFLINITDVKSLQTQGLTEPDERWKDFIQSRLSELDIVRPVKLYLSDRINVPMMLGTLKPVILLPIASMNNLTTEQVEAILLHELAHIKRHDYLLNILQTIAEAILFFNPFVWFISAIIRREREHCCDDMVVGSSSNRLSYVKALAILENNRINGSLAMAATGNKNQLLHRIKRIMEMKKNNGNNSKLTIVVIAVMALTITTAMLTFTPSFAQKSKSKSTTKQTKTSYKYKSVTIDSNGKKTVVERSTPLPAADASAPHSKKNVDVNVTVNGSNGGGNSSSSSSSHSYSYSFTDDMDDDIEKVIADVVDAARDVAASINMKDIAREVEQEMEKAQHEMDRVDWNSIRKEIDKGIAEVELQLKNSVLDKKITKEMRKEMENAKRAMENAKQEMANERQRMADARHEMVTAKREMAEAKRKMAMERRKEAHARQSFVTASAANGKNRSVTVTVDADGDPAPPLAPLAPLAPVAPVAPVAPPAPDNRVESMLDQMETDGLINRSKKYSVSKEDGALYINGEKQSDDVARKYSKYLKGQSVNISGHKNSLSISIND